MNSSKELYPEDIGDAGGTGTSNGSGRASKVDRTSVSPWAPFVEPADDTVGEPHGDAGGAAVAYIRVASIGTPGDQTQIRQQLDAVGTCAATLGLTIKRVFYDLGVSGDVLDREGFAHLVDDCRRSGPGMYVIVETLDRLARRTNVVSELTERLQEVGAILCRPGMHAPGLLDALREKARQRRRTSPWK